MSRDSPNPQFPAQRESDSQARQRDDFRTFMGVLTKVCEQVAGRLEPLVHRGRLIYGPRGLFFVHGTIFNRRLVDIFFLNDDCYLGCFRWGFALLFSGSG